MLYVCHCENCLKQKTNAICLVKFKISLSLYLQFKSFCHTGRRLETLIEKGILEPGSNSPLARKLVVNFRTGTYRRETSQDLKRADYFIDYNFGQPAFSFRMPKRPRLRTLKQSNSSPSMPSNSSSDSLIICNGNQTFTENNIDAQKSLFVTTGKSQETFFDVVSEAAKQAGIGTQVFLNHQISALKEPDNLDEQPVRVKGFIRKGLREKLAKKAELARQNVQANNSGNVEEKLGAANEGENVDSGIGLDTLDESFECSETTHEAENMMEDRAENPK